MRKIESLFIGAGLIAVVTITGGTIWHHYHAKPDKLTHVYPASNFGSFLAAQHAIYVNDFDAAAKFAGQVNDVEYTTIQNMHYLSRFLSGQMPENAKLLKDEKSVPARLIYDAYLVRNDEWDDLYARHKKDESALSAPLRIWSSVATGKVSDAIKFIDKLSTNASWKSFVRGQIYAETGDKDKAIKEFAKVRAEFLNINDYMYLLSFYAYNNMTDMADALRDDFTSRPGGIFMTDDINVPEWSSYSGYKNALAFSLVQNVSHTQVMMYSDLAILFMRFAQVTAPDFARGNSDAINYYLGQFFFNNDGDFKAHFDRISHNSPFYLFAVLRNAEKSGDVHMLQRTIDKNPLFVPGANKLVTHYISKNKKRTALRVVNNALKNENISGSARAHFLKMRAQINYVFGDLDDAQKDIHETSSIIAVDGEVLALQAKIWAAQNREIENAYDYAMQLVKINPTDIRAWDTLGAVVRVREGSTAALEVLERVGEISVTCSSLFAQLGDLYAEQGDINHARDAYMRAIELSDDGLTIIPKIEKKIRKLK